MICSFEDIPTHVPLEEIQYRVPEYNSFGVGIDDPKFCEIINANEQKIFNHFKRNEIKEIWCHYHRAIGDTVFGLERTIWMMKVFPKDCKFYLIVSAVYNESVMEDMMSFFNFPNKNIQIFYEKPDLDNSILCNLITVNNPLYLSKMFGSINNPNIIWASLDPAFIDPLFPQVRDYYMDESDFNLDMHEEIKGLENYIAFHPFADANIDRLIPEECYPLYLDFCNKIVANSKYPVVILGQENQAYDIQLSNGAINLSKKLSLRQSFSAVVRANGMIGFDSCLCTLAAMYGIRTAIYRDKIFGVPPCFGYILNNSTHTKTFGGYDPWEISVERIFEFLFDGRR